MLKYGAYISLGFAIERRNCGKEIDVIVMNSLLVSLRRQLGSRSGVSATSRAGGVMRVLSHRMVSGRFSRCRMGLLRRRAYIAFVFLLVP